MKKSNWKLGLVAFLIMICCVPKTVNAYSLDKDDYDWTEDSTNWIVKKCEYAFPTASESMKATVYIRKGYNYKKNTWVDNGRSVYLNPHNGNVSWIENPFEINKADSNDTTNYGITPECPNALSWSYKTEYNGITPYTSTEVENYSFYTVSNKETGIKYELVGKPQYIANKRNFCQGTVTNQYSADHKTVDLQLELNSNGEFVLNDNGTKYYEYLATDIANGNHSWEFKSAGEGENTLKWTNLFHYLNFNEVGCSQQYMFLYHQSFSVSITGGVYVFVLSNSKVSTFNWEGALGVENFVGKGRNFSDKKYIWTNYDTDEKLRGNECRKLAKTIETHYDELEKAYRRKLLDEIGYPMVDIKAEKITKEFLKEKFDKLNLLKKEYEEEKEKLFTNDCKPSNYTDILDKYDVRWNNALTAVMDAIKSKQQQFNARTDISEKEKEEINNIFSSIQDTLNSMSATSSFDMIGEVGTINCEDPEEQALFKEFQKIFDWIKILVPIILILMGVFDFGKAVLASDEKAVKQAQSRFVKRIIVALIIFLLPTIIEVIFNILRDNTSIKVDDPLCGIK